MNQWLRIGYRYILSCILLVGCSPLLLAQEESRFKIYNAVDGLSNSSITGLTQDSSGYMWIGTMRGLNRFDGRKVVQFHTSTDHYSLPDETIVNLCRLDMHRLAVFTSMGLQIINTLNGRRRDVIVPAANAKFLYKYNSPMAAQGDAAGNLYILGRSGFYHYNKDYKLVFRFDYYTEEQAKTQSFIFGKDVYWLSDSLLILTTSNQGYTYNTHSHVLSAISPNDPFLKEFAILPHTGYIIRQPWPGALLLFKDSTSTITFIDYPQRRKVLSTTTLANVMTEFNWRSVFRKRNDTSFYLTSYQKGFFNLQINKATGKVVLDTVRHFAGYLCTGFVTGSDGRLWIATTTGLLKETTRPQVVDAFPLPGSILKQTPDIRIRQLYCYGNKLYVGCVGRGGLLVFDKYTLQFLYKVAFKEGYSGGDNIFSIIHGRGDSLLIGNGPLYWLQTSTGKATQVPLEGFDTKKDWIAYEFKDSRGKIWITAGTKQGGVYVLEPGDRQFKRVFYKEEIFKELLVPNYITEDGCGNIWMSGHGLCRINHQLNRPDLYMDSFPYQCFPRRQITAITVDQNNMIWVGINNNGVMGFQPGKGILKYYTTQDGLPDNYIKALYPLNNMLWIATSNGMASLSLTTGKLSGYGKEDGFSFLPVSGTDLFFDSATHYLYCGYTNQIVRFRPDHICYSEPPPSFFIESVRLFNDTTYYHPGETLTIPYYTNDIEVAVGVVDYNDVGNRQISYRIANTEDSVWKSLEGDIINFNNLQPGTYRLQVRLHATNNRWRVQQKEIVLMVTSPFWRTPLFIVLATLFAFACIYLIYRQNVNIVRRTERAKVQVQELKAEDYKNRLELEKISSYFSSSLAGETDVEAMLWDVARNLIGRMGYADCMIYMWNDNKTRMLQKAGFGPKGTPEALHNDVFDVMPGQGVVGYVMETKEPVIIADTRKDSRYRPDDLFRLSEVCVPIIHNGELLGVLDTEHEMADYYTERDMKILTTIATLIGNKIQQIESEQSLLHINEQLAEAQLTALQAQMNPHFIFNALNSIKRMILDNENRNASRYLSRFAQMIRLTLNHSRETFVTLQETIEYLHAYLEMEQLRFGSSFSYCIETTGLADEDELEIPTLMIQPLVENAIWHGLMPKDGEKKILIRFEQTASQVTCIIQDNGIGIRASEKKKHANKPPSVGLGNLRNRIKFMNEKYHMSCTLTISDLSEASEPQSGTRVVLQFNILS